MLRPFSRPMLVYKNSFFWGWRVYDFVLCVNGKMGAYVVDTQFMWRWDRWGEGIPRWGSQSRGHILVARTTITRKKVIPLLWICLPIWKIRQCKPRLRRVNLRISRIYHAEDVTFGEPLVRPGGLSAPSLSAPSSRPRGSRQVIGPAFAIGYVGQARLPHRLRRTSTGAGTWNNQWCVPGPHNIQPLSLK